MNITDCLSEDLVITGFNPAGKSETIDMMVDHLVAVKRISPDRRGLLISKLMERESLSSTGIGGGVAIPHASGENIDSMLIVLGLAPGGVDFDAMDGQPVKIIFLIVGSERAPKAHLQLLATIVRACRNGDLIASLLSAPDAKSAYASLCSYEKIVA